MEFSDLTTCELHAKLFVASAIIYILCKHHLFASPLPEEILNWSFKNSPEQVNASVISRKVSDAKTSNSVLNIQLSTIKSGYNIHFNTKHSKSKAVTIECSLLHPV